MFHVFSVEHLHLLVQRSFLQPPFEEAVYQHHALLIDAARRGAGEQKKVINTPQNEKKQIIDAYVCIGFLVLNRLREGNTQR